MKTSDIKRRLTAKSSPSEPAPSLNSGHTVLNMHMTGTVNGGYRAGKYYAIIGDSSSGKTWLCFTAFAEAKLSEHFKHYRLIYDAVEDGADMDVERYFGKEVADAIEPPAGTREEPVYSRTVENFHDNVDNALKDGRPFIYVLDSMDGLSSEDDESKFDEKKAAREKGKTTTGSYGMSKAKVNSAGFRRITGTAGLRTNGSILIVLCQTRDNIGFGFEEKTRAGGTSITFYATLEMWLSIKRTIKKKVKDKDRPVGIETQIVLKKNRITGRRYEKTSISIYQQFGIDDVGGCVDYLVEEGYWKKNGAGVIDATELGIQDRRDGLIKTIEETNREPALRKAVRSCYRQIAEALEVPRKRKYQ